MSLKMLYTSKNYTINRYAILVFFDVMVLKQN